MTNYSVNGSCKNLRHQSRKLAEIGISFLFSFWEYVKNDTLGVSEENETTQVGSCGGGGGAGEGPVAHGLNNVTFYYK